jgi:hypothetical protein
MVKRLQEMLVARGYFLGRVDGVYGERVADAVTLFQRHHSLKVDGECGPLTYAAIEKAPPREERQGVSAQTMAQEGDPIVGLTQRIKAYFSWVLSFLGLAGVFEASGIAMVQALLTQLGTIKGVVERALAFLSFIPPTVLTYLILGGGCIALIMWLIDTVEKAHVGKARSGAYLGA